MNEDYNRLSELYYKYLSKNITDEQRHVFYEYVKNPAYAEFLAELISASYENPEVLLDLDADAKERIFQNIIDQGKAKKANTLSLWPKIFIAAALVLILFSATLVYLNVGGKSEHKHYASVLNDVAPGTSQATLTLSNGTKIKLNETESGRLAEEAGVIITKSENGEVFYEIRRAKNGLNKFNTLSTANGETYKLRLPDGSYVWLNSASSLTYPATLLENGKRTVKLSGEAYFEVAKDKLHPFVVSTVKQRVEVLGTHFNINSYPEEDLETTTLLEGSVAVTSGKATKVISPGEQAASNGQNLRVNEVNTENVVDWKNGDFNLDELDFRVGMRKIARWYDVEVIYEASVPKNIKSGGWISRARNLSTILKHIQSSGQVRFRIEDRKIYVSK